MDRLKLLSKEELLEIYDKLNTFEWDGRIGEEPEGFADMPIHDNTSLFCKHKTLSPYMKKIEELTTEKDRFKFHHVNNLNRGRLRFQWWWLKRRLKIFLTGSPY